MSTGRFRALMGMPRADLANKVIEHETEIERLRKELTLERNTNVHLKASIKERAEL